MILDEPSLTDHYLMQLNADVVRGHAKHPRQVKAEQFRLKLRASTSPAKEDGKTAGPRDAREAAAWQKAAWIARVGMKPTIITVPAPDE